MGNTVIIGRSDVDTAQVEHYCRYENYPLKSFLDYLETSGVLLVGESNTIPDIDKFLLECDQKMPKIFPDMDDLDCYCAGKVLDTLPLLLLRLKQEVNLDVTTGRKSHYFIIIT